MSITVQANDVGDALSQLRRNELTYAIRIRVRKGDDYSFRYGHHFKQGCIVNAVGLPGQEVERSCKSAKEAIKYLSTLLKLIDEQARIQKKERNKEVAEDAKKTLRRSTDK